MKVSWIYRAMAFMFLGFALGVFITSKVFISNLPPSTEIAIGKVKVRGKGNTIENVMDIEDVTTENSETKNKKNRRRKR